MRSGSLNFCVSLLEPVIDAIAHYLVYQQLTFHADQSMGADK